MERIVLNRSATLLKTFYEGGVATDPDSPPVVTVTRDDGSAVTVGGVIDETAAGTWSVTIPATSNTLLDTLTVAWAGVVNGVTQQYVDTVEVAGAVLFTTTEARTALGDAAYDESKIVHARTYAEAELEAALGYALVPRYTRRTFSANRALPLRLRPYVRAIRSVTADTYVLTPTDLAALTFSSGGFLYGYYWQTGVGNVTVGYEHGKDADGDHIPGAKRAALTLAVDYLGGGSSSSIDPRAESIVTVDGTIRLRSAAGQFGAAGVDEWIAANRLPSIA